MSNTTDEKLNTTSTTSSTTSTNTTAATTTTSTTNNNNSNKEITSLAELIERKDKNKQEEEDDDDVPAPFQCPAWGNTPTTNSYLEIYKNKVLIEKKDISKSPSVVFGRLSAVSTILLEHPSVSRKHAALVYHGQNNRYYLIDLQSSSGTYVNNDKIKPNMPVSIKEGHSFHFGSSSKYFVLKGTGLSTTTHKDISSKLMYSNNNNNNSNSTEPKLIKCRHLLVKHSSSRNPKSWREDPITRSKEEAIEILTSYKNQILSRSATFDELASKYSDCSSYKKGGTLDPFPRGKMQKSFEDAAFSLQVGQISDIISSDSGVHIIERLE